MAWYQQTSAVKVWLVQPEHAESDGYEFGSRQPLATSVPVQTFCATKCNYSDFVQGLPFMLQFT